MWWVTDFIPFTGKFRDLQRLTVQYARIVDLTTVDENGNGNGGGNDSTMDLEE